MYIADSNNQRIRKVTIATGIITTIAGCSTSGSYSGDNGQATAANLNGIAGVDLDISGSHSTYVDNFSYSYSFGSLGNVYISDEGNHRIRKVTVSTGIITTIAGNGSPSYSGDSGPATSATLKSPLGVSLDSSGTRYWPLSMAFLLSFFC